MAKDREGVVRLSTGPQRVDMTEGLNKNSRSLHLSCLENQYFPSWWHQILLTRRKPFVKWVLHGTELPLHQNLIYWPSPTASLEQSPRAIWGAASQLQSLFCPQIKLILPLSWHRKKLCIFLVDGYSVQWRDPQWTYLLLMNSMRNQSFGTSSGLLRETNLGKSLLVFEYPILVEILILFGGEQVTAPSRLERNWGWGLCEISRADPLMV